ncbi:LysR family transcriptional regulator [Roseinatronobacter alkalisoli]|uniref:LysR substrate-binding domain-containing protein n=1 Tax=Roseinatronobacter alkalisoli TaxID=3028235 RepID=A0ABT5TAG1_9RHOB|nr:LysR substrate-binding domain-containing protein [Roseinatronobacter sp. HJB301]MDD7970923.1 LysR substrate-binding domain-containing protein [Roseinatronobacter sp. HJB301]
MSQRTALSGLHDDFIRRGLRLPHLRLLVALKSTGQMSGAASNIAITQPAASRLMGELEKIVGAPLYERHAKGVSLTLSGSLLADKAHAMLRQLDDARNEIRELVDGVRGHVRIGAVTGPALEIVIPALRKLRDAFPEIEISVDVETSDKLIDSLLSRDLDFYIGRLPHGIDARAVRMRCIGPEPLALITHVNHPLTQLRNVSIHQCLPYDWVMQPPNGLMRREVETYLLENGYPIPERILSTSSLLLTLGIISETNAIAPVARSVAEFYSRRSGLGGNIALLDMVDEIAISPYSIVLPSGTELSPAARRVLSALELQPEHAP